MKHLENQAGVWIRKAIEIHHGSSREAARQQQVTYVLNLDGLGLEVGDLRPQDSRSDRITVS